jgi:SAM-dependent methyltransferase
MTPPPLQDPPDALADLARLERFHGLVAHHLAEGTLVRLVLSKPRTAAGDLLRVTARPLVVRGQACVSLLFHHQTRDVTKNPPHAEALALLRELLGGSFQHAHVFTASQEWQLQVSKRGKVALRQTRSEGPVPEVEANAEPPTHDRQKRRLLSLATPFLQDLGVTDAQHKLVPAMARKWKQINKFVEVLDHALSSAPLRSADGTVRVVDFGAGKGYLTFALHHHLTQGLGRPAQVAGVELREDLVALCNRAVDHCGLKGLEFLHGDVRSHVPAALDIMIALHACDTATDHALHTGIRAGAAIIMCSPCCHKQIRPQMQMPAPLKPMLQHGIHLGQQAEMVTDSLRALLLEAEGYDAQVFEFVALEHTSKNKMILAVRREHTSSARRDAALQQVAEIKGFYGLREHALESLLLAH